MNTGQLTLFTSEPVNTFLESTSITNSSTLPIGWRKAKLGEVCEKIVGGGTPSTKKADYWDGDIDWVTSADIYGIKDIRPRKKISEQAVKNSTTNLLPPGGIIVVTRVGLGKLAVAPHALCFSQDSQGLVLNKDLITTEYALWCLSEAVQIFKYENRGTTISGVTKQQLVNLNIALPPLLEQHRVVAKIEELFSEIDAGVIEIETALKRLKTFRQAVFHHFLNNDEWERVKLCEVVDNIQIGPFGTQLHQHDYVTGGIPLVNPTHIKKGKIVPDDDLTVSEEKYVELSNYYLRPGDTIMGRRGEMARCALVTTKESGWLCGTGSLFVRPNLSLIEPQFLAMLLGSSATKNYLEQAASGSTMSNLNLKILNNTPILFPDLETQTRVVLEIEARLSEADVLEQTLRTELQRAGRLRQSVLKQAFAGDPTFRRLIPDR